MLQKILTIFLVCASVFLCTTLLLFPSPMLEAAKSGLLLWFYTVLPSLFPFMVAVKLLLASGGANRLSQLLAPIMVPLFHVSGYGAFAFLMGLVSGYPMGAKITADLLAEKKITPHEAQRLLSFANNPGALFVLGAVATGMLQNPSLGYLMMAAIFLSSLTMGILFRFYKPHTGERLPRQQYKKEVSPPIKIGVLLAESVANAMDTVTVIGGFIILFSVLSEGFQQLGIFSFLESALFSLCPSFVPGSVNGLTSGILEMTGGCAKLSALSLSLPVKTALCTFLVSFGGLSILAQTVSLLPTDGISIPLYFLAKIIGGIFAGGYVLLLYPLLPAGIEKTAPVFALQTTAVFSSPKLVLFCVLPLIGFFLVDRLLCWLKRTF